MSAIETEQRQAARTYILGIYEAIRAGRLRVVDPQPSAGFRPRMEVYDDPSSPNTIATFEIPGVKIADISISVKQGMLMIQGVRRPRYTSDRRHPSLRGHPRAEDGDMEVDSRRLRKLVRKPMRSFSPSKNCDMVLSVVLSVYLPVQT
ncbi:hypothetical protein B0H11DRAFT_1903189 [Mycena galericulata]|nr:hypothetical protein B0H11DRAFT_1903189 [Mycena galericulata]